MNANKTMLPAAVGLIAAGLLLSPAPANAQDTGTSGQTYAATAGGTAKNISWYISHSPFPMSIPILPVFPDRDFVITDYGAKGDGQTLNTTAFQKALIACSEAGGGRVIVPPGRWLTGPVELLSHTNLFLSAGATVQFTPDHMQYPPLTGHGGLVSPLYAHDAEDIALTGDGVFDGAGDSWRPVKKEKTTSAQWQDLLAAGGVLSNDGKIWWPSAEAREHDLRPHMLYLVNCRHILIRGVTLRNSPKFVFYPNHCTDLTMDHAHIFNEWWAQNGDGVDISACRNVVIYRCTVNAGDDGICMKSSGGSGVGGGSGGSPDGAQLHEVVVAGCTVYRAHGGFVIGSNTDGGMHNIFVSDCQFIGTDIGLRFKSNMGRGGLVDNIFISDIVMDHIVHEAVLFDTYYEDAPAGAQRDPNKPKPADKTPEFRDFHISRVVCNGAQTGISITGLPQMPVSRISFDSLVIQSNKGLVATQAREIDLHDVKWIVRDEPVYQTDKTADIRVR